MGLDVYAGQLTRYYTQDWETVVQRYARENNIRFEVARANPANEVPRADTLAIITEWMGNLAEHLESDGWTEDPPLEYATDKPDWDCYGALMLWALDTKSRFKMKSFPKEWAKSRLFSKYARDSTKYREFSHLLSDTTIWIPIRFPDPLQWTDPSDDKVVIGSVFSLYEQLRNLNAITWNVSEAEVGTWRREIDPNTTDFSLKAKFGFSIFYYLCQFSVDTRVPMKLDW